MDGVYRNCVAIHADRIVPTEIHDDSHKGLIWKLDDNVGEHEGFPRVRLCWPLANLVKSALSDKVRHDLLDELTKDGEQHEDSEHLVLEALLGERRFEEGEADKERGERAECHF